MSRTIVQTTQSGWYIDAADPDGPKVRRKEDDTVITLAEFQKQKAQAAGPANKQEIQHPAVQIPQEPKPEELAERKKAVPTPKAKAADKESKPHGPQGPAYTVKIVCPYVTGDGKCGKVRWIKPQDAFQVKYCEEHQKAHRLKLKNERTAKRRVEDKKKAKPAAKAA